MSLSMRLVLPVRMMGSQGFESCSKTGNGMEFGKDLQTHEGRLIDDEDDFHFLLKDHFPYSFLDEPYHDGFL